LLGPGDEGPDVVVLQERLLDLGYWLGGVTGRFDGDTTHAVVALQKAAELGRDGIVGPETARALDAGVRPAVHSAEGRVVEIDLRRQILSIVVDGELQWVFDTSTGRAGFRTPTGRFEITKEVDESNVAGAYRPKFFLESRELSIHGYKSVPARPYSHGCARVTIAAMDWIWASGAVPIGTPVWIF
jgi:peptidoglycan hydrolase-like protein with peptidoglycan-binding domain